MLDQQFVLLNNCYNESKYDVTAVLVYCFIIKVLHKT
jgi:hypothetical protein